MPLSTPADCKLQVSPLYSFVNDLIARRCADYLVLSSFYRYHWLPLVLIMWFVVIFGDFSSHLFALLPIGPFFGDQMSRRSPCVQEYPDLS